MEADLVETVSSDDFVSPIPSTSVGVLKDNTGPDEEIEAERFTVPLNPFWLERLIVEVAFFPSDIFREAGTGVTVKSGITTVMATKTNRCCVGSVPVTFTV